MTSVLVFRIIGVDDQVKARIGFGAVVRSNSSARWQGHH
jgi:hypothetical protein